MHPFEPWALLVSPKVGFMAFVVIIVVVRATWYCGDYFLGRWYGERGLQWLKQRRATGRTTAWVERLFPRLGGFLLILYPGVIVSVLAGATGMRFRRFAALILLGLLLWGSLLRLIATAAAEPLTDVAQYVERHAWWLVIPLGVVSVVMIVRESRRRATPQR
jgi:membrane protein DedA with SNARE-associated domain